MDVDLGELYVFEAGELALVSTVGGGLVKVRVLGRQRVSGVGDQVVLRVTARAHPVYGCGEVVSTGAVWVVPRGRWFGHVGEASAAVLPWVRVLSSDRVELV